MANRFRASFDIKLGDKEYTLRPTFEAVIEFNEKSGLDVFEAIDEFAKAAKVKVITAAIWAGIKGEYVAQGKGMESPSFETIGRECQSHGFTKCLAYAVKFLMNATASDETLKKQGGLLSPSKEKSEKDETTTENQKE